jgi:hypothetical protein
MRVDYRPWSHRAFPWMSSQISCSNWVRLRPSVFHVGGRSEFNLHY